MGYTVNVGGNLTAFVGLSDEVQKKILAIKNGWDKGAFTVDGCIIRYASPDMCGLNTYEDGFYQPLETLVNLLSEEDIKVCGEFDITSSWNEYNNIQILVSDNNIMRKNTDLCDATNEELIAELICRGVLPHGFKENTVITSTL